MLVIASRKKEGSSELIPAGHCKSDDQVVRKRDILNFQKDWAHKDEHRAVWPEIKGSFLLGRFRNNASHASRRAPAIRVLGG